MKNLTSGLAWTTVSVRHALAALTLVTTCLGGCADAGPKRHVDIATAPSATEGDSWLRQQRLMRVKRKTPAGVTSTEEFDVAEAAGFLVQGACSSLEDGTMFGNNVTAQLCKARTAMSIATVQSRPLEIVDESGNVYFVDNVTDANAAQMAGMAGEYARWVINTTTGWLISPPIGPLSSFPKDSTGKWGTHPVTQRPWPLEYAAAATEAYYLARAATDRAIEATLSISDQARSSTVSAQVARERALLAADFSRASAAHILVGGADGLLGSTTQGYCLAQDLTPQGRTALDLLREASIPPSLLNGTADMATVLNTPYTDPAFSSCAACGGSVRQRLGAFNNIPALKGGMDVQLFYDLTTDDFINARDYLKQEHAVFGRSTYARGTAFPDSSGFARYGGTGRLQPLPAGAWSARARYLTSASPWYNGVSGDVYIAPHGYSPLQTFYTGFRWAPLETLIAGTHIAARKILKSSDHYGTVAGATLPTTENNEVIGTMASILATNEYQGMLELHGAATTIRNYAHGYKSTDKIRVMVGEDGLRCAIEKNIEGAPCDDPTTLTPGAHYNCPTSYPGCSAAPAVPADCLTNPATFSCLTAQIITGDVAAPATVYYGTDSYTGTNPGRDNFYTAQIVAEKTRLYFVKLKPGAAEKPGNYELLGGAPLLLGQWTIVPVIPSLNEAVARVLAPNRQNCAIPTVNCMGKEYDARLPLEDELTGDGDNVENSWRHYLDLARQAAQESDLLGREFRDAKLSKLTGEALKEQRIEEQRRAAEMALDEVQALCGTAIDSRKLLAFFSTLDGTPSLDAMVKPSFTCNSTTPCPSGGLCVSGKCIKNPATLTASGSGLENDPDARKLAACLDSAVEPFMSLGSKELCVYTTVGRPREVCPSTLPAGTVCPAPKTSTGCTAPNSNFTAWTAKPLSYFVNPQPESPTFNACVALRQARKTRTSDLYDSFGTTRTAFGNLSAEGSNAKVFLTGRLSDTVGKLGFVAKYGGYFDITEDGATRWSSGSIQKGRVSTTWPHAIHPDCASDQTGLFCTSWSSTVPAPPTLPVAIGDMNGRVFRAVAAAAAIRGAMDPTQKTMDITFPSSGSWPVGKKTTTTVYPNDSALTARESKGAIDPSKRGTRTCYSWLSGAADISPWVGPGGKLYPTATAPASTALCFFGPMDPNPDQPGAFSPVMNPRNLEWGRADGFDRVLKIISGSLSEAATVAAVSFNSRQSALLEHIVPATTYDGGALLDGYELLCELDRLHSGANSKPLTPPANPGDLEQMGAYIGALADQIDATAAMTTFGNIPRVAVSALDVAGSSAALSGISGEMRDAIEALRSSFLAIQTATPIISAQLQSMGAANEKLRAELDLVDANKSLSSLEATIAMNDMMIKCGASALTAIVTLGAGSLGAAADCGSMANHMANASKLQAAKDRIQDDEGKIARAEFAERMTQLALTMQTAALDLEAAIDSVNGNISRIESLRSRASLALSRAVYLASYQGAQQALLDQSVGSLSDLAQQRYVTALKNAKVMSFFAKRAIEQRLGITLAEMRDDLPLVGAPQSWEGDACSMGGIDGLAENDPDSPTDDWVAIYGKGFIGDYVNKLERTIESYRLEHNFHEGNDVAVVSLRDDVFDVRKECKKPSKNLFKWSADLSNTEAWQARSCNTVTIEGASDPAANCIQAVPCDASCEYFQTPATGTPVKLADVAVKGLRGTQDGALGYALRFGDGKTACSTSGSNPCGWKGGTAWPPVNSALTQQLTLTPGKYRLSWYTKDTTASTVSGAKVDIITLRPATDASGFTPSPAPAAPTNFVGPVTDPAAGACTGSKCWTRVSAEFTITVPGDYEVGFGAKVATMPGIATLVTIGGPMLESIPSTGPETFMRAFQATDGDGLTRYTDCEDQGGIRFRREHWRRQCVHLCDEGFSGNCSTGPEYCYQEFEFGVAQPWITSGKLFKYSGFARGNFNYRIDSLALNFVGSQSRDCTDSNSPSTCYNAGFIPYSISHTGPFYIRNHAGNDVQTMLFDGTIEHARGLALERYVTNPIASTDRDLLQDYMRTEFAGRPLDGNFAVRIWEEPGVNVEAIEDVQLIVNYRYWTAFN